MTVRRAESDSTALWKLVIVGVEGREVTICVSIEVQRRICSETVLKSLRIFESSEDREAKACDGGELEDCIVESDT